MCSCSSPLSGYSPTAPEPDRRNKRELAAYVGEQKKIKNLVYVSRDIIWMHHIELTAEYIASQRYDARSRKFV